MRPMVSMVVPCYNKVKYIGAFFETVHAQKWDNIELILVNDGSTDGTREIIGEWEPRFSERGYKVIIIDQENMGLPAAVKAGMLRATGEYFCTVDCDDELDPEYVSKMAGFLEENPDYEWACCGFVRYTDTENGRKYDHTEKTIGRKTEDGGPRFAERFLLGETGTAQVAWVYMVRASYMEECGVLKNFHTRIRRTQEPQYFIPLAVGGGKLKILPDKLYKYNIYPEQMSTRDSYESVKEYRRQYLRVSEHTINSLNCPEDQKCRLLFIERFNAKLSVCSGGIELGNETDAEESAGVLLALLDESFAPPPKISCQRLVQADATILRTAVRGNLFGADKPIYEKRGRLIVCGALGKIGRKYLPKLLKTPLEPDILWDGSAAPGSEICGLAVAKPDYNSLMPDDTVLIFPKAERVISEIKAECQARGVVSFIDYYEMLDMLSAHYFPQFYGECRFTPEECTPQPKG